MYGIFYEGTLTLLNVSQVTEDKHSYSYSIQFDNVREETFAPALYNCECLCRVFNVAREGTKKTQIHT